MPLYITCPHCGHPQVVAAHRRGKAVFCRQCGWVYRTSRETPVVRPLAISTMSELYALCTGSPPALRQAV